MPPHQCSYRLHVTADADSTLLSRACGVLACLSLVPESFCLRRDGRIADQAILAIVLVDATARQVDLLQRKLMQMTQVHSVECARAPVDMDFAWAVDQVAPQGS